jgi:DNA-binding IscR family transcriptional regulator
VELWQDIHRAVSQVVDHTTLADLMERQEKKQSTQKQG